MSPQQSRKVRLKIGLELGRGNSARNGNSYLTATCHARMPRTSTLVDRRHSLPKKLVVLQKRSSSSSKGNVIPFPSCSSFGQKASCTTVMIRNIPNQFGRRTLVSILRRHCREENIKSEHKSEFDFVYLPMDFHQYWKNKRVANLGYAFVNFTSYVAALRFYQYYHNREWRVKPSNKICEVSCAKIQGKEALVTQFKNSVFWCHTDMYLPVVFVPACDGVVLPKTLCWTPCVCTFKEIQNKVIID
ncbi:hypothetical protein M0R45_011233 [Rubus argutus]|uniref:Mei2-like C-terminal RNA recognition motif domain-containing protein n=1 Tax=Rubus argutus TaxID=59490 RepID=A0AAW1YBW9_RUBAR